MAKAGTYAAFQRLTPIREDFSDEYFKTQAFQLRRDAINNRRDQLEQQRKARIHKQFSGESFNTINDTKDLDLNAKVYRISSHVAQEYAKLRSRLSNEQLSPKDEADIRSKLTKLESMPRQLNLLTSGYKDKIESYRKGVDEGGFYNDPNFEKRISSIDSGAFDFVLGANYDLGVRFRDADKDGELDMEDFASFMEERNSGVPSFVKTVDYESLVGDATKMIGLHENTFENTEGVTTKTKGIKNEQAVMDVADRMFFKEDGSLTDQAQSIWRSKGGEGSLSAEDAVRLRNGFYQDVYNGIDTLESTTRDASGGREDRDGSLKNVQLKKEEDGKIIRSESPGDDRTFYSVKKPIKYLDYEITSISKDRDGLILRGLENVLNESGKKERVPVVITDPQLLNNIARFVGADDLNQLSEHLDTELASEEGGKVKFDPKSFK